MYRTWDIIDINATWPYTIYFLRPYTVYCHRLYNRNQMQGEFPSSENKVAVYMYTDFAKSGDSFL